MYIFFVNFKLIITDKGIVSDTSIKKQKVPNVLQPSTSASTSNAHKPVSINSLDHDDLPTAVSKIRLLLKNPTSK